jgi:NADPH:quinone reductase-like Zn-dependent oxidoreductase
VLAVVDSEGSFDIYQEMGDCKLIDHIKHPDYSEQVKFLTDNKGVDVIFDPVLGGESFNINLNCVGMYARWVVYGQRGGTRVGGANMMKIMSKKATIIGSTFRNRSDEYKAELIKNFEKDLVSSFESGKLKTAIDSVYPISEASEAFERMY